VQRARDRSRFGGGLFTPSALFASGSQGAFYDPSDFSTLFQNSTGTTAVTAVEQPVGLMLDKSKGLVLGSELVNNSAWAVGAGWSVNSSTGEATGSAVTGFIRNNGTGGTILTIGKWYQATIRLVSYVSGNVGYPYDGTGLINIPTTPGTYTYSFLCDNADFTYVYGTAFTGVVDNISVRELPGNHATQATSASRPTLRARYNLLTYSEEFDNAAWTKGATGTGLAPVVTVNAAVAPDGTTTADSIVFNRGAGNAVGDWSLIYQVPVGVAGSYTQTVWLKAATAGDVGKQLGLRNVANASYLVVTLTADWVRYAKTETYLSNNWEIGNRGTITADNTVTALVWGAQLLTAADQTTTAGAYQRIAAATVYDTGASFPVYLAFDGTDDSFGTGSIDFSATDEMTVFAGVTKLSDAALGIVVELSADLTANNGAFWVLAPDGAAAATLQWASKGTVNRGAQATAVAAPITRVLTGIGDIGGDRSAIRLNGSHVAEATSDQGTGNYGNYPLFIGRRNNTSLPLNGRIYSLIVLGRTATAAELTATETWINGKARAY
jgi:hypothetical protein